MYNENHAIVAWFKRGSADKQIANIKQVQYALMSKAPSGRELAPQATEGERVELSLMFVSSRLQSISLAPSVFCFAKSTSLPEGGL